MVSIFTNNKNAQSCATYVKKHKVVQHQSGAF